MNDDPGVLSGPSHNTLMALSACISADQLGLLIYQDEWLAARLVECLRSWLHWSPVGTRLTGVLHYIEGTLWFPHGQRYWAARLLHMKWPHPLSLAFQQQADAEREQRPSFRLKDLLLPKSVVGLTDPLLLIEKYEATPKRIAWAFAFELALLADEVLPPPLTADDVLLSTRTPLAYARNWMQQAVRLRRASS